MRMSLAGKHPFEWTHPQRKRRVGKLDKELWPHTIDLLFDFQMTWREFHPSSVSLAVPPRTDHKKGKIGFLLVDWIHQAFLCPTNPRFCALSMLMSEYVLENDSFD